MLHECFTWQDRHPGQGENSRPRGGVAGWQEAGAGLQGCLLKSGCPSTLSVAVGEDHLPRTVHLKRSRGSGGCPVWVCCRCPPAAPHSVPAPISAEPPRTAPCLREGRVRLPSEGEQLRPRVPREGPKGQKRQDFVGQVLITFFFLILTQGYIYWF